LAVAMKCQGHQDCSNRHGDSSFRRPEERRYVSSSGRLSEGIAQDRRKVMATGDVFASHSQYSGATGECPGSDLIDHTVGLGVVRIDEGYRAGFVINKARHD